MEERKKIDLSKGYLPIAAAAALLVAVAGGASAVTAFAFGQQNQVAAQAAFADDLDEVKDKQEQIVIGQALMRDDIEDLARAVEILAGERATALFRDDDTALAADMKP